MKKIQLLTTRIFAIAIIMISCKMNYAQLSAPTVENVYGGRILDITGYPKNADTTRFFISTESANSIFYTDAYTNTTTPDGKDWTVMPGVDANAGYGSQIVRLEAHPTSGKVFFFTHDSLLSSHPSSSAVDVVATYPVEEIKIVGDDMYIFSGANLHFGQLDASGNFTEDPSSPVVLTSAPDRTIAFIHPLSGILYYFVAGPTMYLGKMDASYGSGSVPSSNINITPTLTSPGVDWLTFGIAPDGRLFLFGTDGMQKYVAYSDDETTWTEFSMGINGVVGPDVGFSGDSSSYYVYTSAVYSNNKGEAGTWQNFGDVSLETHPNDGPVFVDPINDNIVLLTTDQGLGLTENGGPDIYEIDDGIEAVQVIDFDMTDSKYTGWLASKSGIRKVSDYLSSPSWSFAMFPTGDGSPYSAVAIDRTDTTTVYAGNVRVYKTTDDGTNWTRVFTPESAPYNLPGIGTSCLALEVLPEDHNVVFAGFEVWGPDKGGLFYSNDAGATWDQILIEATTNGQDVDVTDVIFNVEGSDTVAYVSVIYDLGAPQGYSVYKLTKSGSVWSPAQDMSSSGTSVGYSIVVSILDLELSVTGDTVYACGTDAAINEPHVYYKPLNTTGLWTPFTSSGLPTSTSRQAFAVTVGSDTVFTAVDHEIYYWVWGSSSSWSLGYSYPIGTKIHVLYYDELLVGTDLGFYGHSGVMLTGITREELSQQPENFELLQNYPNPFNPSTNITYIIPEQTEVTLKIYNLLGKEIAELVNENQTAGKYTVSFDASNLASGIYFYKLKAGNQLFTRKMMLIK